MGREIERKYLAANQDWRQATVQRQAQIWQGYLVENEQWIVRVRLLTDKFPQELEQGRLTIKGNTPDSGGPGWQGHAEFEYPIPPAEAQELLAATKLQIKKMRRWVEYAGQTFEIDEFADGHILIELELQDAAQAVTPPSWLGREVTGDVRYTNRALAEHGWPS